MPFADSETRTYGTIPSALRGLRNHWMGHAGESMSDLYDKIKDDVPFRKKWAELEWVWI